MSGGAARVHVGVPGRERRDYQVLIGRGLLDACGAWFDGLSADATVLAVTDTQVGPLYGDDLAARIEQSGRRVHRAQMPAGEEHKNRDSLGRLQDEALAAGIDRSTIVVAVGGGVVGDVAGYLAASLLRGLDWVLVPTTLLAMVDSSVGGKTGVDTPAGKNLVGAFWSPRLVVADVGTLETLPDPELVAGLAEVIKYGVILDEELFTDLEDGLLESCLARVPEALALVVERCVTLKADVVEHDERDEGHRAILNFGHTAAHGIEAASGYSLRHGEAVAIGMVAEARLAEQLRGAPAGTAERLRDLCVRAGLPVELPGGVRPRDVVAAAHADKKSRGGRIHCALPRELGYFEEPKWTTAVDADALLAALGV